MRDEGGPLGTGLQGQVSNHSRSSGSRLGLLRERTVVVSVKEQGAARLRQVRIGKTNASEPSKKCRKNRDDVKTGVSSWSRDKPKRQPAYCLGGVRHADGVSPIQALVRNMGTCRPDAKGEIQVEAPRE